MTVAVIGMAVFGILVGRNYWRYCLQNFDDAASKVIFMSVLYGISHLIQLKVLRVLPGQEGRSRWIGHDPAGSQGSTRRSASNEFPGRACRG